MEKILSSEELMDYIINMDRKNSVFQFTLQGKGKFTLVLQEEIGNSIKADVELNPDLSRMFKTSEKEYEKGLGITTNEFLKTLSEKDFM